MTGLKLKHDPFMLNLIIWNFQDKDLFFISGLCLILYLTHFRTSMY